jgi:hypothetical protein
MRERRRTIGLRPPARRSTFFAAGARGLRRTVPWLCLLWLVFASPAFAQEQVTQARASAAAARAAAQQAQAELEAARKALEDAAASYSEKEREAKALEAEATRAETAPDPGNQAALEAAERAERRAEAADRRARKAMDRVRELEKRFAYDRRGFFLGGSVFYAPEVFDEGQDVSVKSSLGASGRIGYRVHPNIAIDVRYDHLDGFDAFDPQATGEIDGWAITGNVRMIFLRKRWQPWIGFGAGAIVTDFQARDRDGQPLETDGKETDPIVRSAVGFDTYLTPNFVLTVEAAINGVGDDRDYINYGQLGVGFDYRF